jgi:hypothetical protein
LSQEGFQVIWNAAIALDPGADKFRAKHLPLGSPDELSSLWRGSGLRNVEVSDVMIPLRFSSFDDLWRPSLEGQGPMGAYLAGLPAEDREMMKTRLQRNILGDKPDRPFTLNAKAWAVRGVVP